MHGPGAVEAFEARSPPRFELIEKFVGAAQSVDLGSHEFTERSRSSVSVTMSRRDASLSARNNR